MILFFDFEYVNVKHDKIININYVKHIYNETLIDNYLYEASLGILVTVVHTSKNTVILQVIDKILYA